MRTYSVQTKNGPLKYYRDDECSGAIRMIKPKTINRYIELKNEHPDSEKHGIFWAFDQKQYDDGIARMKALGLYKDGQKVYSFDGGGFAVNHDLADKFFGFYNNREKMIAEECDPQEVYFYEWNNYECMFDFDGDKRAYDYVVSVFGEDAVKNIKRIRY